MSTTFEFFSNLFFAEILLALAIFCWVPAVETEYLKKYCRLLSTPAKNGNPKNRKNVLVFFILSLVLVSLHAKEGKILAFYFDLGLLASLYGIWRLDTVVRLIPDRFQLIGCLCVIGRSIVRDGSYWKMLSSSGSVLILTMTLLGVGWAYRKNRKKQALGYGDIKLFLWLSLPCGSYIFEIFLLACILALAAQAPILFRNKKKRQEEFAFAPYIILAWSTAMVYL